MEVKLNFKYCYGVYGFEESLEFFDNNGRKQDYLIYAKNGMAKTSLCKTVHDYSIGELTKDEIIPEHETIREIKNDMNCDLDPKSILVFNGEDYDLNNEQITKLLVNPPLKKEYDNHFNFFETKRNEIERKIKNVSGESINTLLSDLKIKNIHDFPIDEILKEEILDDFIGVKYKDLFSDDIVKILKDDNIVHTINQYLEITKNVFLENKVLVKDVFELHNLKSIYKSLNSNNYFEAGHLLKMLLDKNLDVYEDYDLKKIENIINSAEEMIFNNEEVKRLYELLNAKVKSREFNKFIFSNMWVIPMLGNIENLKKEYWYFVLNTSVELKEQINEYIEKYNEKSERLNEIINLSKSKENFKLWYKVIDTFNAKFKNMPFRLVLLNESDVILKRKTCYLGYQFENERFFSGRVEKETLKNVLSKGEKRAFNILNFLFEIEYRRKNKIETVIFMDDIADSFDYRNKYAIIKLLKELNEDELFHLVILTHNFDFYRSCANELYAKTKTIIKERYELKLTNFWYKKNIFLYFKDNINEAKYFLASIPFVRGIIEMSKGQNEEYEKLTNLLHYKETTINTHINEIKKIYMENINKDSNLINENYLNLLEKTCDSIIVDNSVELLENKMCLAIGIRMLYEKYLFKKIGSWEIVDKFTKNQTQEMINYCLKNNLLDEKDKSLADTVSIMVTENIHVNAFMYEPIIDMSDDELKGLYKIIRELK